jgi:hypothetical protein
MTETPLGYPIMQGELMGKDVYDITPGDSGEVSTCPFCHRQGSQLRDMNSSTPSIGYHYYCDTHGTFTVDDLQTGGIRRKSAGEHYND